MTELFEPLTVRGTTIPNRVWMSPMCTYSALSDGSGVGAPNDFHLAHYAARAAGGVGLAVVEATGVLPEGRISPYDLGLWDDAQIPAHRRLAAAIADAGAVPGIQLAHAGRKASMERPWLGGGPVPAAEGGWPVVGPSGIAFPGYPEPAAMTVADIATVVAAWADSARRALEAGYEVVEIHAAHGYLLHSFLSPLSNTRTDNYGGSLENRARIVLEVLDAVRAVWPADKPIFLRISTTDWVAEDPEDGRAAWTVEDSIVLSRWATDHGADLIDASSGALVPASIPHREDYQTRNAALLKAASGTLVAAVGRITDPATASELLSNGSADAVFIGRALLRDASWANNAATVLGARGRFMRQYDYAV
ncbi:NADH:flavin oxidoreductase/NADH oxidase [Arthrobacter glacialis]|uniref:NADH:flavin oxidoreductase/NADH oxidase n=1 Tax=Arthrobacter glacialis TaxID=1664 RepID=UPI000CD481C6|nr:NADH:flavin oxidoreductase/NADH oxidase [Arthrobacter glacialis]POH59275.1 oxidoreductase [Arthrobacter glacialis]